MRGLSIRVYGKVQGVWFRASTKREADRLGLTGTVRNHSDGSVHIQTAGDPSALEKLLVWCHQGPPHAVVEKVDSVPWESEKPYSTFTIIR